MVNQFKHSCDLAVDLGWVLFHHPIRMLDGVKSLIVGHLLLRQISAGHGGDGAPCTLGNIIWQLAFGGSLNDL